LVHLPPTWRDIKVIVARNFAKDRSVPTPKTVDAIGTPFVQGQLRREKLSFLIETECAQCRKPIRIEMDSDLNYKVLDPDASPLVFVPTVDFARLKYPSIIDGF
jgi:hypothetical protein